MKWWYVTKSSSHFNVAVFFWVFVTFIWSWSNWPNKVLSFWEGNSVLYKILLRGRRASGKNLLKTSVSNWLEAKAPEESPAFLPEIAKTPQTWHLDSRQKKKKAFWRPQKLRDYSFAHTSHLDPGRTNICFYSVFLSLSISLCCASAHWLQWEACQPADVHRNSRWSLLEAACLLPGASDHRENCSHSQPRNYSLQHQSSRNSSPARKQHVSQVGVSSPTGLRYLWAYHHEGNPVQWKKKPIYDHKGV